MKLKLVFILLMIFAAMFLILKNTNKTSSEDHIRTEIENANYCNSKEDCVLAGSKCPFGCHILVNKNEEEKISSLIDNYQTTCIYSCVQIKGYDCIDNKCKSVY